MCARMGKSGRLLGLMTVIIAALGACGTTSSAGSAPAVQAAKRTLYMAAVEPKGSTTVDKEPFPTTELPQGGSYGRKAPDQDGRWEVSTYRWSSGTLVVNQGDEVTLEIVGVNGKEHPTVIEGYGVTFNVKRGEVTRTTFTADKAGIFNIVCHAHRPSMTAQLVVLPRP